MLRNFFTICGLSKAGDSRWSRYLSLAVGLMLLFSVAPVFAQEPTVSVVSNQVVLQRGSVRLRSLSAITKTAQPQPTDSIQVVEVDRSPVIPDVVNLFGRFNLQPAAESIELALRTECAKIQLRDPSVVRCEPNYRRYLQKGPDTFLRSQWALRNASAGAENRSADIGAIAAWASIDDASEAVVAIIDSGIDLNHPDLKGALWVNPGEIPGNLIDDDGNGLIDDVHGYNFGTVSNDIQDTDGHGTHVAGIIGASGGNGLGIAGVAPQVRLMVLNVEGPQGITSAGIINSLKYVARMKARGVNVRVVNLSLGGPGRSAIEAEAIQQVQEAGVVVVAAAGNSGQDLGKRPFYPASFGNVVSVAAMDSRGLPWEGSNFGPQVTVAAPGVQILSTVLPGQEAPRTMEYGYAYETGTSMAAPHVAAALALTSAFRPELNSEQLRSVLLRGSTRSKALVVNTGAEVTPLSEGTRLLSLPGMLRVASEISPEGLPFLEGTSLNEDSSFPSVVSGSGIQTGPQIKRIRVSRPNVKKGRATVRIKVTALPNPHFVSKVEVLTLGAKRPQAAGRSTRVLRQKGVSRFSRKLRVKSSRRRRRSRTAHLLIRATDAQGQISERVVAVPFR